MVLMSAGLAVAVSSAPERSTLRRRASTRRRHRINLGCVRGSNLGKMELASTPVDRLKSVEVGDGLADQQQYPRSQLGTWRLLRRGEHMMTAPAVARPPSRAHARSRLHALGRAGVGLAVAGCRGASIWAAPQC